MKKTNIWILLIFCLCSVQKSFAEEWTYNFDNFMTATAGNGPKRAIDAELNGLMWHMYGVRTNADGTDYVDGAGSMRIYGEINSAKELTNFTLTMPRDIGTFKFTVCANETWVDYQKSWIVQWSHDGEQWTTIGDVFTAGADPVEISRDINQKNARVRIVRSDYATYDYTKGTSYSYITNIDNMTITDMQGDVEVVFNTSESALDFGEIKLGESIEKRFTLRYQGYDSRPAMELIGQDASMFTFSSAAGEEGGTEDVTVTCKAMRRGDYKATLHIVYGAQSIDVALTAVGVKANESQLFSGGDGTSENPYLISGELDVVELSDLVEKSQNSFRGKYFRMTNDISMKEVRNFRPIGNNFDRTPESEAYLRPFSGTFDGDGHTVSDLNMTWTFNNFCGLFGIIDAATIKNLTVAKSKLYAQFGIAAIVGVALGSSVIENCHTTADVEISNERFYAAGICAGFMQDDEGRISDCTNAATVKGKWGMTGGVLGGNSQPRLLIERCGNSGTITDENSHVGGIVASTDQPININDCYNTGDINMINAQAAANTRGGGILGSADMLQEGVIRINNCYNVGRFNLTAQNLHPIFDGMTFFDESFYELHNNYYSKEINPYGYDDEISEENAVINLSVATMQSIEFLALLNRWQPTWAFVEGQNKGFPIPVGKIETGILNTDNGVSAVVKVVDGRLIVKDSRAQVEIYDINGRRVEADRTVPGGIYIVKTVVEGKTRIGKILL